MLELGLTQAAVAKALQVSKPTVAYHARALGIPPRTDLARRYDWSAMRELYEQGFSARECRERFGCSRAAWASAVARGDIVPRLRLEPVESLLASGRRRCRTHVKLRLIRDGLKSRHCEECGLDAWRGSPLPLELHHINGDGDDNRLENLRLLCPNCHSQTENWGGRNQGRAKGAGVH